MDEKVAFVLFRDATEPDRRALDDVTILADDDRLPLRVRAAAGGLLSSRPSVVDLSRGGDAVTEAPMLFWP